MGKNVSLNFRSRFKQVIFIIMIIVTMTNDNDNFQNYWTYVNFFLVLENNGRLAVCVYVSILTARKNNCVFLTELNSLFRMIQFLNDQGTMGCTINIQLSLSKCDLYMVTNWSLILMFSIFQGKDILFGICKFIFFFE